MFFTAMPKKSTNFCDDNIAAAILAVDNGMSKKLSVKQFLDEQGRSSPFKKNYPGNYNVFYVPIRSLFKFETIQNKIH